MSLPTLMRETLRPALKDRGVEPKKMRSNIYLSLGFYIIVAQLLWLCWVLLAIQNPSDPTSEPSVIMLILLAGATLLYTPALVLGLFILGFAVRGWLVSWLQRKRTVNNTELSLFGSE
jgi:hypothetical protein